MKRNYIYGILIMALVALPACHRADPEDGLQQGDLIRINAVGSDLQTKAFLNGVDVQKTGTEVKIYDWLTGFTGKINDQQPAGGNVMYIDDAVICTADGAGENKGTWAWKTGTPWRWTRTGVHHFYGWLTKDKDGLTPATLPDAYTNWNPTLTADRKLVVPTITFTKDTPQFDFSYSDIVPVNVENSNFKASQSVNLPLKHLFSAIAVEVINQSPDKVYIKSIELQNFYNTKKATIDFSGERSAVAYTDATQGSFLPNWPTESTLNSTYGHEVPGGTSDNPTRYDLIKGQKLSVDNNPNYIMMWPQTEAEFNGNAKFVVKYYIDGVPDPDNPETLLLKEKDIVISTALQNTITSLDAGVKYRFSLEFKDKTIKLTLVPLPWTMDYADMDYSTSTILANSNKDNDGVLWLYKLEGGYWSAGDRNRQITMVNGSPIQGRFYILAPTSGQWQISTYPAEAAKYFLIKQMVNNTLIDSNSGAIEDLVDAGGEYTGYVEFYIYPNPAYPTLPATQQLHFDVNILLNGQWRNANTEFNRKDWTLTRNP